jgi:hypothetical protein
MMKLLPWLIAAIVLTTMPASGRAEYILSLSTSADVNHLQLGESVTFDVSLSGIDPSNSGTDLSYLAATIGYDNNLISPNPIVAPAMIIPNRSGFVGTGFPTAADGYYDGVYLASTPISQDGTFFSFQVTTLQAGSGTLSFTATAATLASDSNQNDQFTPQTIGLNFTIEASGPGTVVPEPPTFVLLISSFLGGLLFSGMRNLVRRARPNKMPSQGCLG